MKFENFEVYVVVDDANLPEYGEETRLIDGTAHVSCWIPSREGQVSFLGVCIR